VERVKQNKTNNCGGGGGGKKEGENRRARKNKNKKNIIRITEEAGLSIYIHTLHYTRAAVTIVASSIYAHMSVRMGTSHRNCTPGYKRASAGIG